MNSGTIWGRFVEKLRGKKSRATVPLTLFSLLGRGFHSLDRSYKSISLHIWTTTIFVGSLYAFLVWWGLRLFGLLCMPGWFLPMLVALLGLVASALSFYNEILRMCVLIIFFYFLLFRHCPFNLHIYNSLCRRIYLCFFFNLRITTALLKNYLCFLHFNNSVLRS